MRVLLYLKKQFKADGLQMIVVAKKYICVATVHQLLSSAERKKLVLRSLLHRYSRRGNLWESLCKVNLLLAATNRCKQSN